MKSHRMRGVSVWVLGLTVLAWAARAQTPVLVLNGLSDDISAGGTKTLGYVFDYSIPGYTIRTWERGVGYSLLPGGDVPAEWLRGNAEFSAIVAGRPNTSDWGNLNCFNGYCFFDDGSGCTLGDPLPAPDPCIIPTIAQRWTAGAGWVNPGSIPRVQDAATGRFFGGTRCDSNINTGYDISGDGGTIVGAAWSARLLSNTGGPAYGLCGEFVAYRYTALSGVVERLPVQADSSQSKADSINFDGTVICGYDQGQVGVPPDQFEGRRACVWTNNAQTILNGLSYSENVIVNAPGTFIAGGMDSLYCLTNFGVEEPRLVRWTRTPGTDNWVAASVGRPIDFDNGTEVFPLSGLEVVAVSDDGNTIVGTARYGSPFFGGTARPFVWRPTINGGVPIDLVAYIQSIAPTSGIGQAPARIRRITGMSGDGNALNVLTFDETNTCTPPEESLFTGNSGVLYLNGAGIACDRPRIGLQPGDFVSTQYTPFGVALNVTASGSFPMAYQWQREDSTAPAGWVDLTEACSGFPFGGNWDYEGVFKNQLRVGQANCGNNRGGRYRVVITNSCGTVTSEPATVTFAPGVVITQQPENETACPTQFGSVFAVGVSNDADMTNQWEIADAATPTVFTAITDGMFTAPDGRVLDVFGSAGQFLGFTPAASANAVSNYLVRCQFLSACGNATSNTATVTIGGPACIIPCDDIDFNNDDVFPSTDDIFDFLSVFSGGACSTDPFPGCNDIDFNNDGVFPSTEDIDALLRVFGGAEC